ncbi:site-specific DNA-methyltransferase [Endozoicomonas lisbonensis]|uniref:site-specific DNA-methyltransferase (adenine-specific) n=1 Tax=Endozoicomonas lisbonensis TaxID=3120522 RepID=A0ABV2SNH7_9GAMM
MEKITETHANSRSMDIVADNISKLKQLFPELITEDADGAKIDADVLKELVGQQVIDGDKERYNFSWHGKAAARRLAQTPSTGTLRPCKAESKHWDTTKNLFIEGDNLEVLKLLQKSYHKKVKMIYIDPPYNTGKDFVYSDNYKDNIKNYLELTSQTDDEGYKLSSNPETSGRYHSNWLNMIYPRLKLARNLLKDDGLIFISIDEHEIENLKKITDEIFGEGNFIAQLVWEKTRKNDAKLFSIGHEYILVYAKSLILLKERETKWREPKPGAKEIVDEYKILVDKYGSDYESIQSDLRDWYKKLPKNHPSKKLSRYKWVDKNGPWRDRDISWPGDNGPSYDVIHPETKQPCRVPDTGWRFSNPESMQEQIDLGLVAFRYTHEDPPFRKAHLLPVKGEVLDEENVADQDEEEEVVAGLQVMPSVMYKQSQVAVKYLKNLMGAKLFDNPKDHEVLARIFKYCDLGKKDIVLDFFAGSCSTAESIINLNLEDQGDRKFIVVQLPEACNPKKTAFKNGYKTISELGLKRISLAGERIVSENQSKDGISKLDIGFKFFKLDSSNIKPWDADFDNLEQMVLGADDSLKEDRSAEDVLYEILLKYGLDLTLPIEEHMIGDKTVYNIGFGALMVCLDNQIEMPVIEGIGQLNKELQPEMMRVVFKDAGFANDVVKTNAIQVLKQYGIDDVKSI